MPRPYDPPPLRPHPVFARLYDALAAVAERGTLGRWRAEVLGSARGVVAEVGAGSGRCFRHYPEAVSRVIAVEPDATMRRLAEAQRGGARVPVHVVAGRAERLPIASASVDTVVSSLMLCSVPDVAAALHEMRRVLAPDGQVLVLEHVRARPGSRLARWQDRLDPLWGRCTGGCHTNRRTAEAFAAAGFDTSGLERRALVPDIPLIVPHVLGTARPR